MCPPGRGLHGGVLRTKTTVRLQGVRGRPAKSTRDLRSASSRLASPGRDPSRIARSQGKSARGPRAGLPARPYLRWRRYAGRARRGQRRGHPPCRQDSRKRPPDGRLSGRSRKSGSASGSPPMIACAVVALSPDAASGAGVSPQLATRATTVATAPHTPFVCFVMTGTSGPVGARRARIDRFLAPVSCRRVSSRRFGHRAPRRTLPGGLDSGTRGAGARRGRSARAPEQDRCERLVLPTAAPVRGGWMGLPCTRRCASRRTPVIAWSVCIGRSRSRRSA